MKKIFSFVTISIFLLVSVAVAQQIPMMMNHQGYIASNSSTELINGDNYFKFAIVNTAGDTTHWSNDDTSVGGAEPTDAVTLAVTDGVYTVKLGDTGITNMTSLPTIPFENQDIYLRMWFSEDGITFEQFSPDTQLVSAGFAHRAESVSDGAITSAAINTPLILSGSDASGIIQSTHSSGNNASLASSGSGVLGTSVDDIGVVGESINHIGLQGSSDNGSGVYGFSDNGTGGNFRSFGTDAVSGFAGASGDVTNYGGRFLAWGNSGRGVYGEAIATGAVSNYGGYFSAGGIWGEGVHGLATGTWGIGVHGVSDGDSGRGVYGEANSGTAGYFISTSGYGLIVESGNAGLGVTNPAYKLDVNGDVNTSSAYKIGGNTALAISGDNTFVGFAGLSNTGTGNTFVGSLSGNSNTSGNGNTFIGKWAGVRNIGGTGNTFLGLSSGYNNTEGNNNTNLGFLAGYNNNGGSNNVFIGNHAGYSETGSNKLYIDSSNTVTPLIYGDFTDGIEKIVFNGNVGIGDTTPAEKLSVSGSSSTSIVKAVNTLAFSDAPAIYGEHSVTDYYGVGVKGVGLYRGVEGTVSATGSDFYYGIYGNADTSSDSGTTYGVRGQALGGSSSYGGYFYSSIATGNSRGVYGEAAGGGSTSYGGYFISTDTSGTGLYASGGSTGYAAKFRGNVQVQRESDGTVIMELGEGLDYAEGFNVSDKSKISTGMVLIIDPDNPGKLKLSDKSYDTKVAGIVAGANGLGSGIRLGAGQFDRDVALAGRVFCNVDATEQGIEAGDLLTTSDIAGYAMKAVDYNLAQGAILGKAMEKLEKGKKGQILVLVTLQ